jgi:hypothetical protein
MKCQIVKITDRDGDERFYLRRRSIFFFWRYARADNLEMGDLVWTFFKNSRDFWYRCYFFSLEDLKNSINKYNFKKSRPLEKFGIIEQIEL